MISTIVLTLIYTICTKQGDGQRCERRCTLKGTKFDKKLVNHWSKPFSKSVCFSFPVPRLEMDKERLAIEKSSDSLICTIRGRNLALELELTKSLDLNFTKIRLFKVTRRSGRVLTIQLETALAKILHQKPEGRG